MSEYALSNPSAWAYLKPMIEENNGWAAFMTTPRGRNHAFEMSKYAQHTKDWFYELLTARDTEALTEAQMEEALAEYRALYGHDMGEGQFRQEYFCDFQTQLLGGRFTRTRCCKSATKAVLWSASRSRANSSSRLGFGRR